jgi:TolA-binding protein
MKSRVAPVYLPLCIVAAISAAYAPAAEEASSDYEFKRVAETMQKASPSQELVDTLYTFMEKFPRDPHCDQIQFWVAQTQQRRKFHHEAIKEFGFVVKDFPDSKLVLPALRAQANSYLAIDKEKEAGDCFNAIVERKPKDFKADGEATGIFREAVIWLADRVLRQKEPKIDEAVGLITQLPDQRESVSRIVEIYVGAGRFDEALTAIERLPDSDRFLSYQLLTRLYSARPGTANLFELFDRVVGKESPSDRVDELVRNLVGAISSKAGNERHKALERVVEKYDRLKRWAEFSLCEMDRASDLPRLTAFVGDYRTGGDVEQCKSWIGAFHEAAGDAPKAREAYGLLNDKVAGHFLIAETYYGPRAKKVDLDGGEKELTEIVKRFYSNGACCEALMRRAELQSGRMNKPDAAAATLREVADRFPAEGNWPIRALMRLGQLLRDQKKYDEAIVAYERVILKYNQDPAIRQAWLEIAAVHESKGSPTDAIATYKTVLRKFPRTREASRAHTILETKYNIADVDVSDR